MSEYMEGDDWARHFLSIWEDITQKKLVSKLTPTVFIETILGRGLLCTPVTLFLFVPVQKDPSVFSRTAATRLSDYD